MRLFNFMIPEQLDARLKAEHQRTGIALSEIVRRSVDEYLERKEERLGDKPTRQRGRAKANQESRRL